MANIPNKRFIRFIWIVEIRISDLNSIFFKLPNLNDLFSITDMEFSERFDNRDDCFIIAIFCCLYKPANIFIGNIYFIKLMLLTGGA